jgi:hypothetical protein
MNEEDVPENPIRRFMISPQIFKLIKSSLMDPEMEELPTDYTQGLDLRIIKTSKGGFADYSTSNWSRKESALTEAESAAIETYKLSVLGDFLPKKPGDAELKIITEMFEASVDGEAYDPERWGQYYRPRGVDKPDASVTVSTSPTKTPVKVEVTGTVETVETVDEIPFETTPVAENAASGSSNKADDILAQIRARQKA